MAKIIIIDDSLYMRTMLKHILQDAGHEIVAEASDGESAMEVLRETNADLVTLDIILPDTTGLDLLKQMREENIVTKVVMITSVGQEVIVDEALSLGASDYLVKPFSEENVVKVVRKLVVPAV